MSTETARRINFTKATINAIEPPTRRDRVYIYDRKVAALTVAVTRTGVRTFYVYKRVHGRPVRVRLGRFPELAVEQARKLAAGVLADIARGGDPQAERRALREQCTLRELFEHQLEFYSKAHCRESYWRGDVKMFDRHLSAWASRRIDTITTADVVALHGRLGKKSPYAANRLLALIKKTFNHGRRTLKWDRPNPCTGVRLFKEHSRDRFLDAIELKRFFLAIKGENEFFQSFFLILLLTGARRNNVESMAWADVDLERGLWRIPGEQSKNREPMVVILVPEAVEILHRRREATNGSEFVFPSTGKLGHLAEPKKAWKRICERAKLEDFRVHDLRRTLGSWQAAAGASLPIIGRSLGHKSLQATQVYARLSNDPVRESVGKATTAMLQAADGTEVINGGSDDE